jgi:acylphosphatase
MATHFRISGRVQGVGYRAGFAARAAALQLSGWVRNRADGSVEAMVSGAPDAIAAITEWARRGPPGSEVRDLLIDEAELAQAHAGRFNILPTA